MSSLGPLFSPFSVSRVGFGVWGLELTISSLCPLALFAAFRAQCRV
jgi:hypothetical protein